jgi:TolB-like protein/two-component SAPR family response regulator
MAHPPSKILHLTILGGFIAEGPNGRPVDITSKKNRALLAILALSPQLSASRDGLANLLWSDRDDAHARSSLRQSIALMRRELGETVLAAIDISDETISLIADRVEVDALNFLRLAEARDAASLRRAAELYRGELLAGFIISDPAFDDWLESERARFSEIALRTLDRLVLLETGPAEIATAKRLLALDQMRESSHRLLMQAYAHNGEKALALKQFDICKELLHQELHVAPAQETAELRERIANNSVAQRSSSASSSLPNKPSIAVMPFQNLSGNPEQEYFADGLTEDIITALSRVSGLTVIARTSSFIYKGQNLDTKRVAGELGVAYVMEGSVRRAGDRLRVTAQLIDGMTGHHVWAERYDRPAGDIFDIQDEIMRSVAASTETQIQLSEGAAIEARRIGEPKAAELVMRAWGRIHDFTPEALAQAAELAERAILLEPMNPRAHIIRARVHMNQLWFGVIAHNEANVETGLRLAETGVRLAPRDEWAHFCMAFAYEMAGRPEDAVAECRRAIELNPNFSNGYSELGRALAALGQSQEAIEACRTALRLNPRDPSNWERHNTLALAHFTAEDYEASLQEARTAVQRRREVPEGLIILAAAASALGAVEEATRTVAQCAARWPNIRLGNIAPIYVPIFREADRQRLWDTLRKVGFPE